MEREILFRAKCVNDGEQWIEGVPIKTHIGMFICFDENPHYCSQYGYMEIDNIVMVDENTVGQYTGWNDKNGRKIFEGDIVKTKYYGKDDENGRNFNSHDIFQVTFDAGCYCFSRENRAFTFAAVRDIKDLEVIGNIFDNQELLKEE